MLNLKKITVAALAFASTTVLAGTMGPACMTGEVTVPCEQAGWGFGIQALYLKPSYSGARSFLGLYSTTNFVETHRMDVEPQSSWGFKLEASYQFYTGNDLNLNWYHLGSKITRINAPEIPTVGLRFVGIQQASIEPKWDAVNLEFGQHIDFNGLKNIRLHAGVQLVNIKTTIGAGGSAENPISEENPDFFTYAYRSTDVAKYTGFGPRVGADMSYAFGHGFSIYGNGAAAILAGSSKNIRTYSDTSGSVSRFNPALSSAKATVVAPELEAKLGINYTFMLAQGNLTLDAGYMLVNYFDVQLSDKFARPGDNNFNVHGPYAGLKWVGVAV